MTFNEACKTLPLLYRPYFEARENGNSAEAALLRAEIDRLRAIIRRAQDAADLSWLR